MLVYELEVYEVTIIHIIVHEPRFSVMNNTLMYNDFLWIVNFVDPSMTITK